MPMCNVLVCALVSLMALVAGPAASPRWQPEGAPAGALANHPAARMVGVWRGTGSALTRDGKWHTGKAVERARWNLAGTAILVEGYGYAEDPATGARTVSHDAVGLIEHDAADNTVRFYARRAGADFDRFVLETDETTGVMRWNPKSPPESTIRFIITITDTRWHEIGEMSRDDGATWTKFLETDLARSKDE